MNTWIKKFVPFIAAGIVYLAGQYFRGPWFKDFSFSICHKGIDAQGVFCDSLYINLGLALIAAAEVLAIVSIILLFANQAGFRRWFKFSLWYIPVAAVLVIWFTPTSLIALPGPGTPDYTNFTWILGYLYILITVVITLWSWWRTGREASAPVGSVR